MIKPFRVRGLAELQKFLKDVPVKARRAATEAAADYLIGDGRRGLRHYPAYKWIRRRRAYPEVKGWFSEKQRRFVMARIRSGRIDPGYPHRTGRLQRGWVKKGSGYKIMIENQEPYAAVVMGDNTQARQPKLVGWRTVGEVVESNTDGMRQAAARAVQKTLDK